ncbi:MAG: metallophosphoesterase [Planctomycetota bacterium]
MSQTIPELLQKGLHANNRDAFRRGNVVHLPGEGRLIATGDIHGHRRNFERIVSYAALARNKDCHLIIQEILHGGPEDENGGCLSFELLVEAVKLKIEHPDQVHFMMGNHDTAWMNNSEVMKGGREMNAAMHKAIEKRYGQEREEVELLLKQFLFSQPLGVRCENRIWLSHSLPADRYIDSFDAGIFTRTLQVSDIVRPQSVYLLTWGRQHSRATLEKMAQIVDADLMILGHQHQETGFKRLDEKGLIIASDHDHGVVLPMDLSRKYSVAELVGEIVPLASIL